MKVIFEHLRTIDHGQYFESLLCEMSDEERCKLNVTMTNFDFMKNREERVCDHAHLILLTETNMQRRAAILGQQS